MNRSNVGNITTNAMQTLNISGTAAAAIMRRSIADVSTTLNASAGNKSKTIRADKNVSDKTNETDTYAEAEEIGNIFANRNIPVKSKEPKVYNAEYTIRDENAVLPENISPQSEALVRYVSNNLDWQKRRG